MTKQNDFSLYFKDFFNTTTMIVKNSILFNTPVFSCYDFAGSFLIVAKIKLAVFPFSKSSNCFPVFSRNSSLKKISIF